MSPFDNRPAIVTDEAERDTFFEWRKLAINLTTSCNLRCKMCPVIYMERNSFTREQAFNIADFADRRGFRKIILTGGEPTLLPYFWDLLERLAQTSAEIQVLTNAYRLSPENIAAFARCPRLIINISIDGIGPVHDAIRAPGTFERTESAIRDLIEAGCRVAVNTTVQRSNCTTLMDIYDYFKDFRLEWHAFNIAEPIHGKELVPKEKISECLGLLRAIARRNALDNGHTDLDANRIACFRVWLSYPKLATHPGLGCPIPRRQLLIEPDGLVLPCPHYGGWRRDAGRNINTRTLDEMVDSPDYEEEIRRAIGPGGCPGCSSTCYFLDDDYRNTTLHPTGRLKAWRVALHGKEYLREYHPRLFALSHQALEVVRRLSR